MTKEENQDKERFKKRKKKPKGKNKIAKTLKTGQNLESNPKGVKSEISSSSSESTDSIESIVEKSVFNVQAKNAMHTKQNFTVNGNNDTNTTIMINTPNKINNRKPIKYSERDNGPFVVFAKQENIKELSLARNLKNAGITNIHNIYRVNESMLKIIFKDKVNANKALDVQQLLGCECFVPEMYTNTYGVIKNIDIEIELEEISDNIKAEVPIISLERIKSYNHTTKTLNDTSFVKIGFRASYLPRRVFLYEGLIKDVTYYLPKPMFCTQCISYGHMKKRCHSRIKRCAVCGEPLEENLDHQCKGQNCRFCLNDHITNSKNCEERKIQIKIRNVMTKKKVTYREAKKLVAEKLNFVPILDTTSTIQFPNLSMNTARINNINKVNDILAKANSHIEYLTSTLDQIKQKLSNMSPSDYSNSGKCANDLILIDIAQILSEDQEQDNSSRSETI